MKIVLFTENQPFQKHVTDPVHLTLQFPVQYILDSNGAITVSADILATNGAWPSAGI